MGNVGELVLVLMVVLVALWGFVRFTPRRPKVLTNDIRIDIYKTPVWGSGPMEYCVEVIYTAPAWVIAVGHHERLVVAIWRGVVPNLMSARAIAADLRVLLGCKVQER